MKAPRIAATALALSLALPLSGCFATDAVNAANDAADAAQAAANAAGDLAQSATEAANAFSSIEWTKESRLVLKDAATGETLAEEGNQAVVQSTLSALSQENSVAAAPDARPEYVCEVWQPATETVLESSDAADEQMVLEVTTFAGSDVVEMRVPLLGMSLCLSSPGTADALRHLAG